MTTSLQRHDEAGSREPVFLANTTSAAAEKFISDSRKSFEPFFTFVRHSR
jgi:hypothetical protein